MSMAWRFGARACDIIIVAWLEIVATIEVEGRLFGADLGSPELGSAAVLIAVGLTFLFEVVPVVARGVTAGKAMLGLRVAARHDGDRPGLAAAVVRWLVLYGLLLVPVGGPVLFGLNAVLVATTGRGIHDRAAGTVVVDAPERRSDDVR